MEVLNKIIANNKKGIKKIAVLLDPEKTPIDKLGFICEQIAEGNIEYIFVGGTGFNGNIDQFVLSLRSMTDASIILFPGHISQFTPYADALLFMSVLTSTRQQELIEEQKKIAKTIKNSQIESIPMGYILVDGGRKSAVEKATHSKPLCEIEDIVSTALEAELLGKRLVYLEAGSGAANPVRDEIIRSVKNCLSVPLIVGGGICTTKQMEDAFNAGADIVVIGNFFEKHPEQISVFGKRCK